MAQKYIKDDIVMYKNRIHTIIDTLGLNNYELSYVRHSVNQAELSGIPLTLEILEKNGWKRTQIFIDDDGLEFHTYIDDERCLDLQYYPQYKKFAAFICKQEVLSDIEYVHQLQHLLFGLGLNHEMEV